MRQVRLFFPECAHAPVISLRESRRSPCLRERSLLCGRPAIRRTGFGSARGLTLIEVLVVVAIIALLVAILTPSLSQVRWQARNVACKANLHDLGAAFTLYAHGAQGDYYPVTPNVMEDTFWSLYKARGLKAPDILICPASRNVIRSETLNNPVVYRPSSEDGTMIPVGTSDLDHVAPKGRDDPSGGHSYEYNGFYDEGTGELSNHHKRASHFRAPHLMMLVHDADEDPPGGGVFDPGCHGSLSGSNNCPQAWDNHGHKGMNMMFGDGHAVWTKKLEGIVVDRRVDPPVQKQSPNATIDTIWLRSQYPWLYTK